MFFQDQMNVLFQGANKAKFTTLLITSTKTLPRSHHAVVLLKLIEKWLKAYDEQDFHYKLITHDFRGFYDGLSFELNKENITDGTEKLIQKKIKESNKGRLPKIISSNTRGEQFEESSDPIWFVNIGRRFNRFVVT